MLVTDVKVLILAACWLLMPWSWLWLHAGYWCHGLDSGCMQVTDAMVLILAACWLLMSRFWFRLHAGYWCHSFDSGCMLVTDVKVLILAAPTVYAAWIKTMTSVINCAVWSNSYSQTIRPLLSVHFAANSNPIPVLLLLRTIYSLGSDSFNRS